MTWGKTVCEQFSVYCMECFLFSVLWFNFMNKKNMLLLLQLKKCPPFKTKSCCIGRKVLKLGNITLSISSDIPQF